MENYQLRPSGVYAPKTSSPTKKANALLAAFIFIVFIIALLNAIWLAAHWDGVIQLTSSLENEPFRLAAILADCFAIEALPIVLYILAGACVGYEISDSLRAMLPTVIKKLAGRIF